MQSDQGRPAATTLTHEEMLQLHGFDLCSPVSGSMRPMVRPRRDSLVFERPKGRLRKYDVALYKRGSATIMHRVIRVRREGYVIRGDNAREKELVGEGQIIGVMTGFYRDERFIPATDRRYRVFAQLIVWAHPVLPLLRRLRRLLKGRKK